MLNTFKSIPLPHLSPLSFSGSFVYPSFLPPPHPQLFIFRALSFTAAPHLFSRCKAPPTWTLPAPATRQPPPLVPATYAAGLHLPPFPVSVLSPLCRPRPAPRSLSSPGGFTCCRSLRASVSLNLPPRVLLGILKFPGHWFLVRWLIGQGRDARAPPLPGNRKPWSSLTLLLVHAGAVPATRLPTPPPLPPLHPPCVVVILYPSVEEVWGVALYVGVLRAGNCHGRGCLVSKTEGRHSLVTMSF